MHIKKVMITTENWQEEFDKKWVGFNEQCEKHPSRALSALLPVLKFDHEKTKQFITTLLAAKDREIRDKLLHDIEESDLARKAAEKTGEPLYVYGFEDCTRRIKALISPIK